MRSELLNILKNRFEISEQDLFESLDIKEKEGGHVADILVDREILTENQFLEALGIFYGIPFYPELPITKINTDFTGLVPIQFLKEYLIVPLHLKNKDLDDNGEETEEDPSPGTGCVIAVNDPAVFQPFDDLISVLKKNYDMESVQTVLSTKDSILSAINYSYDQGSDSAEQLVQDMEEDSSSIISEIEETADLLDDRSDAPLIKLVNHIISQAIKARASDIHIEPFQHTLQVRYRVDGILYDLLTPPKHIQSALISRVKVMAKMNIAEKRLPQDGRIEVKKGDQDIDIADLIYLSQYVSQSGPDPCPCDSTCN